MRFLLIAALVLGSWQFHFAAQEQSPAPKNVTCTFEDGKEISLRYKSVPIGKDDLQSGKPYMPGGSPMLLFSQVELSAANSEIPAGAFSLYVIPESKEKWNFVINRNVSAGSKYDPAQDLARLPMDLGKVETETKLWTVVLVHAAPKQCNVRIYHNTQLAAWAGFKEK